MTNTSCPLPRCPAELANLPPAYVAATATSVALAVSLTRLVPRLRVSPTAKQLLGRLVPFVSVASAGVVK
jgi:hypothetical protein